MSTCHRRDESQGERAAVTFHHRGRVMEEGELVVCQGQERGRFATFAFAPAALTWKKRRMGECFY